MQTVFGSGVATGRFAIGSNEALGQLAELEAFATTPTKEVGPSNKGKQVDNKGKQEENKLGKRRGFSMRMM
jgi:hypothetical protein